MPETVATVTSAVPSTWPGGRAWSEAFRRGRGASAEAVLAAAGAVVLGVRFELPGGLTAGTVLALVLLPVWLPRIWSDISLRWLPFLAVACVLSGWWLTTAMAVDHVVESSYLRSLSALLIGLVCGAGLLAWAVSRLGRANTATFYGIGLLLGVDPGSEGFAANPWKAGFSLPLTVLLLGLAWRTGKAWPQVAVGTLLAVVSAMNDSRSAFGFLAFSALVVLWFSRRGRKGGSTARSVLGLAVLGLVLFNLGQALILEGALGEATQTRSERQIQASGSILLGSRPELGAAAALAWHRPAGLGAGTVVNSEDLGIAKEGMASLGYDPQNGYVEGYMFGGHVELHSVLGDLWAWFGVPGAVFAILVATAIVRRVVSEIGRSGAVSALLVYCAVRSLWDLAFSPFYTSMSLLMLTLALVVSRPSETSSAQEPGRNSQASAERRPSTDGSEARTASLGSGEESAPTRA